MKLYKRLMDIGIGCIVGAVLFGGVHIVGAEMDSNPPQTDSTVDNSVRLQYNGVDITPQKNKPFIKDGTTYVPIRWAAGLLHAGVEWNDERRTVELTDQRNHPESEKLILTSIDLGMVVEHQLEEKIGAPNETIEEGYGTTGGCYQVFTMKYDGFDVSYYLKKTGTEYHSITVTGKAMQTIRGVGVGSTIEEVRNAYGDAFNEEVSNGSGFISYGNKLVRLIFYFKDNKVEKYGVYESREC